MMRRAAQPNGTYQMSASRRRCDRAAQFQRLQVFSRYSPMSRAALRRRSVAQTWLFPPTGFSLTLRPCPRRVWSRPSRSPVLHPAARQRRLAAVTMRSFRNHRMALPTRLKHHQSSLPPTTRAGTIPGLGRLATIGPSSFRSPRTRSRPSRRFCAMPSTNCSSDRMIRVDCPEAIQPRPAMTHRHSAPI